MQVIQIYTTKQDHIKQEKENQSSKGQKNPPKQKNYSHYLLQI